MTRKCPNRISLIISIITLVSLLAFNGCMFFGGGGKEEAQTTETAQEETALTPVPQKLPIDESRLQEGKYNVIQTIESAGPDGQIVPVGSLDWSNSVVSAMGFGKGPDEFSATTAALVVAEANLLGTIQGIQIDSTTTVKNASFSDQTIERKITGVLKGAVVVERKYNAEEQTATVVVATGVENVAAAIPGEFRSSPKTPSEFIQNSPSLLHTLLLIDSKNQYIPQNLIEDGNLDKLEKFVEPLPPDETVERLQEEIKALKEVLAAPSEKPQPHTGLIINAGGLNVKQVLFPRIYYRDGDNYKLLYGDITANRPSKAVEIWAGWAQTLSDAKAESRVKGNPLVVQAIGVSTTGEPAISAKDAKKIESLEKEYNFLKQGKIVIIR